MEAEGYSLQTRNGGHRKTLVPRSPTRFCLVSVGVATLAKEGAGEAGAGGPPSPLWMVRDLDQDAGGPPVLATLGLGSPGSHKETRGASLGGPWDGFQLGPRAIPECCLAPWAVLTVSTKSPCSRLAGERA